MKIGKWYDPISQRWIEPRDVSSTEIFREETALAVDRKSEAQRIWDALVDCCARG
jgi:hypothetical protein